MKRAGIEGIYLGGWATSAKGSADEDPGPDLASYPLSQVPDEAAGLVRALLTADRNQQFARSRMTEAERAATPEVDFTPFIIADADTGHGGDAHVRNLIRRFVEAGVPGYHIEDQKPGRQEVRAPGRQGARLRRRADQAAQLRPVPARHHGRAGHHRRPHRRRGGEPARRLQRRPRPAVHPRRDEHRPCRRTRPPTWRCCASCTTRASTDINGHLIYAISDDEYAETDAWLTQVGLTDVDRGCRQGPPRRPGLLGRQDPRRRSPTSSSRPGRARPA